ncbi:MAG: LLM class flavin-dependent oxidoreductase [Solirubrobacteraceae bacterium]|nr:LLM class flavin-dependent oxidoreductase [Solirubrobacteraceae bacterium]
MPIGCFVSTGRSLTTAIDRVRLAEDLGYDSAFVTHIAARDALQVCMAYTQHTERIRLGTGVVPIYSRTPATMAQEAATIHEASDGRFALGIGVSHRPVVEHWHGQRIDKPVTEMREYTGLVRAILRGEQPPEGAKWRTSFQLRGLGPFPQLPLLIAALSPNMLRLAGEIADGVVLWLCNPAYIRDVVVPSVRAGRERAGKSMDGFEIVAAVPAAATDEPQGAYESMRRDLLPYFGLPFYRAMLERSGFAADIAAYDAGAGDPQAMGAGITDEFLGVLTAIGDESAVRAGVERYRDAGVTLPCVGAIPSTDFEATLRAASGAR